MPAPVATVDGVDASVEGVVAVVGGVVAAAVVTGAWVAAVVVAPSPSLPQAAAATTRGRASSGSARRIIRFMIFLHNRAGPVLHGPLRCGPAAAHSAGQLMERTWEPPRVA